ncbi:hypothetical protein XA68_17450 [Ophiocordyceps unilateralis]|uniref:Polyketide synthase methyltransferase domain-containing protein n=1 Tax=Ophiocordyceps unilateralis TaxID=268505 RepID=A0A2A9PJ77_OPHUN|nr:hypothetical protein XA68_17450 [Ophiocordyceps unilateralis]
MTESWLQALARSLICRALGRIRHGQLRLKLNYLGHDEPDVALGTSPGDGSDQAVVVMVNNARAWVRMFQSMDLGFAEAYMLQEVDCHDLLGLFCLHIANLDTLGHSTDITFVQLLPLAARYLDPGNVPSRSRLNIAFHYDESNDVFSNFLSEDMNYSSALWSGDANESLESAQLRKVQNIIDKAKISSSHHVLDIGCGWGHLAIEAARQTGCRVTGLTLSKEQKQFAEDKIVAAGLQDNIDIVLCDYREAPKVEGGYDQVISIEMLEHVGSNFMNRFFQEISALLNPETGLMVIQGITTHRKSSPNAETFMGRYIFPGGYLHSSHDLLMAIHDGSKGALEVETVENIGPHYVRTLQRWRQKFLGAWPETRAIFVKAKPDTTEDEIEAYRRRWEYYFTYCEAGFYTRMLGDYVISAVRPFSQTNCRQLVSI